MSGSTVGGGVYGGGSPPRAGAAVAEAPGSHHRVILHLYELDDLPLLGPRRRARRGGGRVESSKNARHGGRDQEAGRERSEGAGTRSRLEHVAPLVEGNR